MIDGALEWYATNYLPLIDCQLVNQLYWRGLTIFPDSIQATFVVAYRPFWMFGTRLRPQHGPARCMILRDRGFIADACIVFSHLFLDRPAS